MVVSKFFAPRVFVVSGILLFFLGVLYLRVVAQDAIRESGFPSLSEVAKLAGMTLSESELALRELTEQDKVIKNRSSNGEVHYALKYAN